MSFLRKLTANLPEVKKPNYTVSTKEKILWTLGALVIFFVLGHIYPVGIDQIASSAFERLEILLGAKTGTLITTGIGPIVLASIFLQLAMGSGIIKLNMQNNEDKKYFQGLQKLLAIILAIVQSAVYVSSGYIPSTPGMAVWVVIQLALGSIVLIFLDEIVQKYGFGSGVSLFIAAGVSQAIFLGAFSWVTEGTGIPTGLIPRAIYYLMQNDIVNAMWSLVPLIFTILVFLIAVYFEGMKIEIPISFSRVGNVGARYPLKFLYVSNIPVILASAVLLNVQLLGLVLSSAGVPILGTFDSNHQPISGLALYVTPLPSPLLITGGYPAYIDLISSMEGVLHMLIYGIALISLSILFGWFWVQSTGMDASSVSSQLSGAGLNISGYRQDPRVMERILHNYIPALTVLGSFSVAVLAWIADITGALGTGTGILLAVGIIYKLWEDLGKQQVFETYSPFKGLF